MNSFLLYLSFLSLATNAHLHVYEARGVRCYYTRKDDASITRTGTDRKVNKAPRALLGKGSNEIDKFNETWLWAL